MSSGRGTKPIRSGSRPNFPPDLPVLSTVEPLPDYLHRLDKAGSKRRRTERSIRRRIRSLLPVSEALHPALQTSSSESDKEEPNSASIPVHVEWNRLEQSPWANESLFGAIPVEEISSLVGWATHRTSDSLPRELNPLHCLPNIPPRPSCLRFLRSKSRPLPKESSPQIEWKPTMFLMSDLSDEEWKRKPPYMKFQTQPWQVWEYNSGDETYQKMKGLKRKKYVQVTMPKRPATERPILGSGQGCFCQLEISGQVAVGMWLEELLTASLLPLAYEHVARCRALDVSDPSHQEWTLPAEEAVARLPNHLPTWLPSTCPPTSHRLLLPNSDRPQTMSRQITSSKQGAISGSWCESRKLERRVVQRNMDLLSRLLPCAPRSVASAHESFQKEQQQKPTNGSSP